MRMPSRADDDFQLTCRFRPSQNDARSSRLRILPGPDIGSSSRISMLRGHLWWAMRALQNAMMSTGSTLVPGLRITMACTCSPQVSFGMPMTAHCATAGCCATMFSTSAE